MTLEKKATRRPNSNHISLPPDLMEAYDIKHGTICEIIPRTDGILIRPPQESSVTTATNLDIVSKVVELVQNNPGAKFKIVQKGDKFEISREVKE
jgi:bifunctional DNA-binding transcriptional regulator/antitoxin component of YhaV-PrlF toxin-antitoxin module